RISPPFLHRHLRRGRGISPCFGNRFADQGLAGNVYAIGDVQMAGYPGVTAQGAMFTNAGPAGDTGTGGHGRSITHFYVMGNLNQVIQNDVVTDLGITQRTTVDAGIGTNFDIVTDAYATQLGNFMPAAFIGCETKTIGTNNGTGMNLYPFAQHHIVVEGDVGAQNTTGTQHTMVADYGTGADLAAVAQFAMLTDHHIGADADVAAQAGTGGDNRAGMNAGTGLRTVIKKLCHQRKTEIGILNHQRGAGRFVCHISSHNHGAGGATG